MQEEAFGGMTRWQWAVTTHNFYAEATQRHTSEANEEENVKEFVGRQRRPFEGIVEKCVENLILKMR